MRLVLMGAPGSGKGTQAKLLGEHINVPHISSGDMLRDAIHRNTALGVQAKAYMDRGELVPDEVLLGVMEERLQESDCRRGFILDGFPRTAAQAESLNSMLEKHDAELDSVAWIDVPRSELIQRLSGRRTCRSCGASYHVSFDPPKKTGVCDRCGGELFQRPDDSEETISARLRIYEEQTAPLLDYYRKHDSIVAEIDGTGSPDQVLRRLLGKVGAEA